MKGYVTIAGASLNRVKIPYVKMEGRGDARNVLVRARLTAHFFSDS